MIGDMTSNNEDALHELARAQLPADIAERWIGLFRPGIGLGSADGSGAGRVVGRLGGLPGLPAGQEWPVWEGHGPLSFIASVDLGELPHGSLDIDLPADGTLAFFYFDGQADDGAAQVYADRPESRAGARVVYVPADAAVAERPVPPGLTAYAEVPLVAWAETTAPYLWHPLVYREFGPMDDEHPLWDEDFKEALWDLGESRHRIGGHADPVQDEVETEVAHGALGCPPWNDPRINEEALRWLPLAQFDSDDDAGMMWGDGGSLYWLIRPEDLAARRFDRAMFTWQCS